MKVSRYKAKGRWYFRVDGWIKQPNGKLKRARIAGLISREKAENKILEIKANLNQGIAYLGSASEITVESGWKIYQPISEQNKKSYEDDVGRSVHLLRHLGHRKILSLTLIDIDNYRAQRFSEVTRTHRPPTPASVDREFFLLRAITSYLKKGKAIPYNPLAGIPGLNKPNTRDFLIKPEDLERLMEVAKPHQRILFLAYFDTGLRGEELLDLRWSQLDFKAGFIDLGINTKTGQPRTIPISERLHQALNSLPRGLRNAHVFINPRTGKRWAYLHNGFKSAFQRAGLEGAWRHDLRRAFATQMRDAGTDVTEIMSMTGHSTLEAFKRYNIVRREHLKRAMERFEDSIQNGHSLDRVGAKNKNGHKGR